MSGELNGFNYTVGIYDVICRAIRVKLREEAQKDGAYGIGVYTDRYCEQELMTQTMKKLEDRMEIARSFEGVDFVFSVDTRDSKSIEEVAQEAYLEYLEQKKNNEGEKKYKIGFAIGSFDLFHAGHLENLTLAKNLCDKLIVVLKTDERIRKKKNKSPRQSTGERAEALKCIKIVDDIIYYDVDATRQDIIDDIMSRYKDIEPKDIVAIFGSDLQKKEEARLTTDWANINVAFTNRDSEKMKLVSSTNYQKICDANGGIQKLVEVEEASLE